jgi:fimbrial chaperone protein
MEVLRRSLLAICVLSGFEDPALSASLQVSPVSLELVAPSQASELTLHNLGDTAIDAQIRVFHWTEQDGKEQLTPTTDVVASPPAANLLPGQDYTVRVVRVSDKPVEGEEAYRLLVDELPQPSHETESSVKFTLRYSLPVFFRQPGTDSQLIWTASAAKNGIDLTVRNEGTHHVRVSSLKILDSSGGALAARDGLVGYVLPHSTARWNVHGNGKAVAPGSAITIAAQGNDGPIAATTAVQPAD